MGLALAVRLADHADVVVLDRRPEGVARPQLLVARPGDLARLADLGLRVSDPELVSPIARRRGRDHRTGARVEVEVPPAAFARAAPGSIHDLRFQRPVALVAIARLQAALAARARQLGVELRYDCAVSRIRRHAQAASLDVDKGGAPPLRARMVVIATGASQHLVPESLTRTERIAARDRLIAGVFERHSEAGRFTRAELHGPRGLGRVRCVLLETDPTAGAGTALLVQGPDLHHATERELERCFDAARELHRLPERFAVAPRVFETGARSLGRRMIAGDNRAPVVIAGDAAQSGHVFSGMTCFANLAVADQLAEELRPGIEALVDGRFGDPLLGQIATRYKRLADTGAKELMDASVIHQQRSDGWATAGVA